MLDVIGSDPVNTFSLFIWPVSTLRKSCILARLKFCIKWMNEKHTLRFHSASNLSMKSLTHFIRNKKPFQEMGQERASGIRAEKSHKYSWFPSFRFNCRNRWCLACILLNLNIWYLVQSWFDRKLEILFWYMSNICSDICQIWMQILFTQIYIH